jgi:uncharacterized YigZ family protein
VRYRTLTAPFEYASDPIKGSKFLAVLAPSPTEDQAMSVVRATEARFADTTHQCWAWRLRDGRSRSWDAGEPRGSAGRPILAQLEGHDVHDLVAIVVRWYGGTPLGVGGLMRAYGGTAGMALDRAPIEEVPATRDLVFEHSYDDTNALAAALAPYAVTVVDTAWDATVHLTIRVDEADADAVIGAVRDRTGGRVRPRQDP